VKITLLQDKLDETRLVYLPPMISKISECRGCFSKEACTLVAISIEENIPRPPPVGQFPVFNEISSQADETIRAYFKKFIECITLEQSVEMNKIRTQYESMNTKESKLKILKINKVSSDSMIVTL
jgi:hypothetical protein